MLKACPHETPPPEGISADAWYWEQSLRDFGPKFVEPGFNEKLLLDPTAGDGFKLEIAEAFEVLAKERAAPEFPGIEKSGPDDDYYDSKVKVLSEMIKHHVKEEEQRGGMFAEAKQSDMDLVALGEQLANRKKDLLAKAD